MLFSRRSALGTLRAVTAFALLPLKGHGAQPLRIGVIGAGSLGGTVGGLWVQSGHEVLLRLLMEMVDQRR